MVATTLSIIAQAESIHKLLKLVTFTGSTYVWTVVALTVMALYSIIWANNMIRYICIIKQIIINILHSPLQIYTNYYK